MSARDHLPAHLVPAAELHGDFGVLRFGTPPSPQTALQPATLFPKEIHDLAKKMALKPAGPLPPPIVTIRPAGPHASELYVRTGDGAQLVVVPLSYGTLINLLEDATAALRRCEETR